MFRQKMNFRERRNKFDWMPVLAGIFAAIVFLCLCAPARAETMYRGHADVNLVIDIIECESSGKYNAVGDDGVSVGIAQFQEQTFNEMKRLAHMPHLKWKRPIDQLRLMVWMLDNGFGYRWTCYRKLTAAAEPADDDGGKHED